MEIVLRAGKYFGSASPTLKFVEPLHSRVPDANIIIANWNKNLEYNKLGIKTKIIIAHSFAVYSTICELEALTLDPVLKYSRFVCYFFDGVRWRTGEKPIDPESLDYNDSAFAQFIDQTDMLLPENVITCFHFQKSGFGPKNFNITSDNIPVFQKVIPNTDHNSVIDAKILDVTNSIEELWNVETIIK